MSDERRSPILEESLGRLQGELLRNAELRAARVAIERSIFSRLSDLFQSIRSLWRR